MQKPIKNLVKYLCQEITINIFMMLDIFLLCLVSNGHVDTTVSVTLQALFRA